MRNSASAPLESHPDRPGGRGLHGGDPRPSSVEELDTPLRLVCGAVGGSDPPHTAAIAAKALGRAVIIAVPALGPTIVQPVGGCSAEALATVTREAEAAGQDSYRPTEGPATAPVLVGGEIRGLAVAVGAATLGPRERSWLEAAATAAAIELLMRDARAGYLGESRAALLRALASGAPDGLDSVLSRARRLGVDLRRGAVALCAQGDPTWLHGALSESAEHGWLAAEIVPERLLGLIPLALDPDPKTKAVVEGWRQSGVVVTRSAGHSHPRALRGGLVEAELLLELAADGPPVSEAQAQTLRLLISVLLRDRPELEALELSTIAPLLRYDAEHETELLTTLDAFLSRHGSTSETAESLALHRHTVGYRLARVQELSGLSPYESDGRERLSLGLKAHHVLEAEARRLARR